MFARAIADDLMSDCDLIESLNEDQNINLPAYGVEWITGYGGNGVNNIDRKYFRTEAERDEFVDDLKADNVVGIKTFKFENFYHTLPEGYEAPPEDSDKMWAEITWDELLDKGRNNWDDTDWDAYYAILARSDVTESCYSDKEEVDVEEKCEFTESSNTSKQKEAEKVDLWSLVYATLQKNRDLAANNMIKNYKTLQLPLN